MASQTKKLSVVDENKENKPKDDGQMDMLQINELPSQSIEIELKWYEKIYVWLKSIDYNDPKKVQCATLLDSVSVTVWMTLLTLWALYAEDFKIAVTDRDADVAFSIIAFVAYVIIFTVFFIFFTLI